MRAPSHRVANALTPLGQRVKAIDLLRFLNDSTLRQQVRTPLHRGESRQDVAPRIFFADQGMFRSGDYYQMMNRASCLNLLLNAVLVYNTLRIARVLECAKAQGQEFTPEAVAHVSPLVYRHVIVNGTYDFSLPHWTSGRMHTETYGCTLSEHSPGVHAPDVDVLKGFSGRFSTQKSASASEKKNVCSARRCSLLNGRSPIQSSPKHPGSSALLVNGGWTAPPARYPEQGEELWLLPLAYRPDYPSPPVTAAMAGLGEHGAPRQGSLPPLRLHRCLSAAGITRCRKRPTSARP